METDQIAELTEELEQFQREKDKIRRIVGQIGGKKSGDREKLATIFFIVLMLLIFVVDVARHLLHISMPLPPLFSIEVGVLLVSIKIIWMIHRQSRVEHFQFWILNSIEFRLDQVSNNLRDIEKQLRTTPQSAES